MGKKKSPAAAKKRPTEKQLETVFCCRFCYQGSCVECFIDMNNSIGVVVVCSVCLASYNTNITPLIKPINVYKESLDKYTLDQ